MRRNVAGQFVCAELISKTSGDAITTGTTTVYVTGDAGTQGVGSVGSGAATHEGNGLWSYAPSQAETNYTNVCFTFVNTNAINANVQLYPVAYDSSGQFTGVNVGSVGTGGITAASFAAGAIDNAAIATDAIGSAELASSAVTEIQSGLSTLDAAGVRTAVGLATANLDTQLSNIGGYIDTEVGAIKAKTDNLPSDPADASDIASAFSTLNSAISTLASYVDTEVAAIKTKTDNLPAAPADASDIATAFTGINTKLDSIDDFLDTEIAAIKSKTDNLPPMPADVSDIPTATENADELLKRDWTLVTGEADRSVLQALRPIRNKSNTVDNPGEYTVYKEDDMTEAWRAELSTDVSSLPITGVDPTT